MQPAHYLLGTLVAEVGGADHQDRRQQPRDELTQQQRRGQDEHQLVAQGSDRDPLDHRQFAIGGDAVPVLGGHPAVAPDPPPSPPPPAPPPPPALSDPS